MWKTTVYIGVFWDGGSYELPIRRWRWVAILRAWWHLQFFPYRRVEITRETV